MPCTRGSRESYLINDPVQFARHAFPNEEKRQVQTGPHELLVHITWFHLNWAHKYGSCPNPNPTTRRPCHPEVLGFFFFQTSNHLFLNDSGPHYYCYGGSSYYGSCEWVRIRCGPTNRSTRQGNT